MIKQAQVPFVLLCLIFLVGCSAPIFSTPENFPNPTSIYQTVSAGLTATSNATFLFTLTPLALKTVTPSPTNLIYKTTPSIKATGTTAIAVTQSGLPCNRATAGKPSIDVTIPDGTVLQPGQPFSKTWRVVNSGSCTWTGDYALVWFSGESFSSVGKQNFSVEVPGGQSVDITMDMVAPNLAGIHQSNWKFGAPDGTLFGLGPAGDAPFWVRIDVEDLSTPVTEIEATLTPTSIVVIKDTVILEANQGIDLDLGKINAGTADDLKIGRNEKGIPSLLPLNGARIGIFGSQEPAETDCRVDTLSSDAILLSTIPENSYLCYRTNMGLPGFGKLSNITDLSLTLNYTTWMVP
jgi:hypothetical protein